MLLTWFITIITFLIGYTLGALSVSPEKKEQLNQSVQRVIRRVKNKKIGAIDPLSPREMDIKGTRLEETERTMEEDLDNVLQGL